MRLEGADGPSVTWSAREAGRASDGEYRPLVQRTGLEMLAEPVASPSVKREIPHLCRDVDPPLQQHHHHHPHHPLPKREHPVSVSRSNSSTNPTPEALAHQSLPSVQIQTPILSLGQNGGHSHSHHSHAHPHSHPTPRLPQPIVDAQLSKPLYSSPNATPLNINTPFTNHAQFTNNTPQFTNNTSQFTDHTSQFTNNASQFSNTWPLIADPTTDYLNLGNAGTGSNVADDAEFGILSEFLKTLKVPAGEFIDLLSDPNPAVDFMPEVKTEPDLPPSSSKGKAREINPSDMPGVSRIDKYLLAAADQPSGPRASRLSQVIKAKYDAGLLRPYDYIKGYERMNRWMDSGRSTSIAGSVNSSPYRGPVGGAATKSRAKGATVMPVGTTVSPESRRRILAAIAGFRPKFRQISRTLTDVDLIFVEEAVERLMLEYDRALASIHTPSCVWRRTGEIQKANQEFANLTGLPAKLFRNGQLCVYELMDEDSAVRYWEGYGKIAFDPSQRSIYTSCTLKIPLSLTKQSSSQVPHLNITQASFGGEGPVEEYREVKCCFSVTIRRDAWGIPVAIMGQWIQGKMTTQGDPGEGGPVLRLRITHITSTMSPPLPTLQSAYLSPRIPATSFPPGVLPHTMPVLRIFGTTPSLQKICANIHLCYPYFFVPFPMDSPDPLRPERVLRYCQRFAVSLNHAICLAMRQNPSAAANVDGKHLHVVSVMLVKGVPFYGYHIGYSYFMKVSLVNPSRMHVALEQLRKPTVLGREWQPHEAHMNHVLQFMADFDLYGCGWLNLSGGTFRDPLPVGDPYDSPSGYPPSIFDSLSTPQSMLYPPALSPPKDTFTPLEIDVLPNHILNRNRLQARNLHNDFVELLRQPLDPEEKLVPAMKELWEDERRRRISKGLGTSESAMLPSSGGGRGRSMQELGYKVEGKEGEANRGGNWKISDELWEMLEERMGNERRKKGKLNFERFAKDVEGGKEGEKRKYDKWIMTTFESVSAHWPRTPHSTQKSRGISQRGSSRPLPPSSSQIPSVASSSPVKHEAEEGPKPEDLWSEDEEENPFEVIARSQTSQPFTVEVEVNQNLIQRDFQEDDDDVEEDESERRHLEEGQRLRATQAPKKQDAEYDAYDDQELDKLFRSITGGYGSNTSTPRRKNGLGSDAGNSTGRSTAGSVEKRKEGRRFRLMEQAGFGDLSTIIDRSSVSLSPSPLKNPYNNRPITPSKLKTPVSTKTTPTSLVRNMFARNRQVTESPSKRTSQSLGDTIVLPPTKTALGHWSPSPEEPFETEASPTPVKKKPSGISADVNPDMGPLHVKVDMPLPPARQSTPRLPPPTAVKRKMFTPTFRNDPTPATITEADNVFDVNATPVQGRSTKRVRLADSQASLESSGSKTVHSSTERTASSGEHLDTDTSLGAHLDTDTSLASSTFVFSGAWRFRLAPPLARDLVNTMETYDLPSVVYQQPFYSNPIDVPSRPKMFAGRMFTLKGNGLPDLLDFESSFAETTPWLKRLKGESERSKNGWEYAFPPPTWAKVVDWCAKQDLLVEKNKAISQLARPTQKNKYGFKFSQKRKSKDAEREHQNMSVLALEVFAQSRHQLLPDPEKDEIVAVFYCFQNEEESLRDTTIFPGYHAGYVVVDGNQLRDGRMKLEDIPCHVVDSELDLVNWVIDIVKAWDPDVLAGWEMHNASWGYLASRANEAFSVDLMDALSRVVSGHGTGPKKDFYSATHTTTFKVSGRHVLNIWRILRSEVNLTQYTFENVVFHLLHQRVPHYSSANLTALWKSKAPGHSHRVLKYFFQRVVMYIEILDSAEVVTKNAEFARVFGVDFASVMFRGSQFKVESFMFRIAKPESFVLVSPSKQQVGLQNAPFAVPLIAEPESKYYTHPIIVLDFQSLYPSVMIAYNICYSTCLGRVEKFKGTDKFGFTELKVADGLLELLKDYLTVTPNGMVYVKPAVRKSLLAKMLGEILDTRVMVKHAMKGARSDKTLTQLLNARQLGLKLMANVTYGYTSATYSGRMPCIEVADSIVQTGRETLERAQELIHSRADWNAQIVYGDTDSLFIALPGRSKEQAFKIGNDMADTITSLNPKPVKLKFEKVYMGSILMAKKRYVGFKFEHPDDVEPSFDAKGIETIRRDGFPAQQKMEEVCLKMLFRTQDLSQIKDFCRQEWTKILQGRVSIQDFIVAKEVRLGSYSDKGVPPPGAAVAYRRILKDPRDEPQHAERVPYLISNADGRRLIDRARMPEEMLGNRSLGIDAEYYIRNLLIPPLSRIFNLVGADVENWYDSMPRTKRAGKYDLGENKVRIDSHFRSSHCAVCGAESSTSAYQLLL
ncbi:DNA polymerase zeta, partial [Tremellales sp. Uapishka_1]